MKLKWFAYTSFTASLAGFSFAAHAGGFTWWSGTLGFGGLLVTLLAALTICIKNRDFPEEPF